MSLSTWFGQQLGARLLLTEWHSSECPHNSTRESSQRNRQAVLTSVSLEGHKAMFTSSELLAHIRQLLPKAEAVVDSCRFFPLYDSNLKWLGKSKFCVTISGTVMHPNSPEIVTVKDSQNSIPTDWSSWSGEVQVDGGRITINRIAGCEVGSAIKFVKTRLFCVGENDIAVSNQVQKMCAKLPVPSGFRREFFEQFPVAPPDGHKAAVVVDITDQEMTSAHNNCSCPFSVLGFSLRSEGCRISAAHCEL